MMMKSFLRIVAATLSFGAVHSGLASLPVKRAAVKMFGQRAVDGSYRAFFVLQSLATFALLAAYILRQPRQVLYRLSGLPALILRLGQAAGLGYAVYAAHVVGLGRISGLDHLLKWIQGESVPVPPAAQGPEMGENGSLTIGGPFLYSRHPLNLSPLPVFWLTSRMTTSRLAFNLAATLYLVLGSLHEEVRLKAVYGKSYKEYHLSGIPFYWPRFM